MADSGIPGADREGTDEAMICILCNEEIKDGESRTPHAFFAHVECAFRSVVGGYGHLVDHHYWCSERGDPDGGMSYRQSALAAWAAKEEFGVEALLDGSLMSKITGEPSGDNSQGH
jgi:hypothetical protein